MTIQNPPKALIVLIGMICITVLMAVHAIEQSAGTGLLGSIIGYAVGNGFRPKDQEVPPIFAKKD